MAQTPVLKTHKTHGCSSCPAVVRFQEQVIINANLWGITESKRNGLWLNGKPSLVTLGFNDQKDKGRKTRAATDLAILAPR